MPLLKDKSDASFKTNVRTLMGEVGKSPHVQSRSQALAVAFAVKRRGRAEGGRAFSIRSLPPNQLAIDAGVDTVGLRRGPMSVTTKDRLEPLDEDYNFGRAARAISSKINPEAFEEAVRNMPMSTNIEDRRGEPTRADPIGKIIERFGSGNGMAEGQQMKQAGFAQGGPPRMSVTAPYYARAESRSMLHSGPINSMVPGRTDRHNVTVGSGSYVIPSDTVSHLGQNNTQAGQAILHKMFSGGPYGSPVMKLGHGPGAPKPPRVRASGGGNENEGKPVPIVVAGGEYTVPENVVKAIGGGDIAHGHKILDAFVLSVRKKHIKTLRDLPPPAKS